MKKTKKQRHCRMCGAPEKKGIFGYTNVSPYLGICADCLNRAMRNDVNAIPADEWNEAMEREENGR